MVAAKSLLTAALASLVWSATAPADAPTVQLSKADEARAATALLHRSDLGAGWAGGAIAASSLTPPKCPGFDPKESDLTVTGHADARFTFISMTGAASGVEIDQDVQVLATPADVEKDFRRSVSQQLGDCLAHQLAQLPKVVHVSVVKIEFPPTGSVSAAYHAVVTVRSGKVQGTLVSDYVFFGEGRMECEFTIIAPAGTGGGLARFELGLTQRALTRAQAGSG